jgi:hypothetical protein
MYLVRREQGLVIGDNEPHVSQQEAQGATKIPDRPLAAGAYNLMLLAPQSISCPPVSKDAPPQ